MTTSDAGDPGYDILTKPEQAYVFALVNGGWVPVARVVVRMLREGWPQADLVYGRSWKSRSDAFAIDPLHMPLDQDVPPAQPMYGALLDAGPDRWGGRLLDDRFKEMLESAISDRNVESSRLRRLPGTLDRLLLGGDDRVGCLAFGVTPDMPLLRGATVPVRDLAEVEDAMVRFDAGEQVDRTTVLLASGTSLGGARPKCTVRKEDGSLWLAKFKRRSDDFDVVRIEHASMALAAKAGISVPATEVIRLGRREALLVRRFDRDGDQARHHYLSALSLSGRRDTDPGGSYAEIADNMRKVDCPAGDISELFTRMAFNVAIGNTDDHLKNHGLMRAASGWKLTPMFDVLPNIGGEDYQAIGVGNLGATSSRWNVLSQHGRFGLQAAEAEAVTERVAEVVQGWRGHFAKCGVKPADIKRIEMRIVDLAPKPAKTPGGPDRTRNP